MGTATHMIGNASAIDRVSAPCQQGPDRKGHGKSTDGEADQTSEQPGTPGEDTGAGLDFTPPVSILPLPDAAQNCPTSAVRVAHAYMTASEIAQD